MLVDDYIAEVSRQEEKIMQLQQIMLDQKAAFTAVRNSNREEETA